MSSNKLNNLKLTLLLKELSLLEGEKDYNDKFIEYYKPLFMEEVLKLNEGLPVNTGDTQTAKNEKVIKIQVSEEEEIKIKSIFRSIAKICHPDKTTDEELIKIYSDAQKAYDENDLLTLYKISKSLNIEVNLDENNIFLLQRIVDEKKKQIKSVESSFLWLWVNAKTDEEKMNLIKMYISQ
jgi:hypothetical protein